MIFVDTSAWFAVYSPRDENHVPAVQFLRAIRDELVTTDYVIDETPTLLRVRHENRHALAFGHRLIDSHAAQVIAVDDTDFSASWQMFRAYRDKEWSFTDCTCFVVMERLGITQAFAFDDHFRQSGKLTVVP
jgi:predicted nucleic acid-binding protein